MKTCLLRNIISIRLTAPKRAKSQCRIPRLDYGNAVLYRVTSALEQVANGAEFIGVTDCKTTEAYYACSVASGSQACLV